MDLVGCVDDLGFVLAVSGGLLWFCDFRLDLLSVGCLVGLRVLVLCFVLDWCLFDFGLWDWFGFWVGVLYGLMITRCDWCLLLRFCVLVLGLGLVLL